MTTLLTTLFLAGMLTILLPCILPLLPIVVGVSISGRSKWRPLLTVLGMVISFLGFTFLLLVVLRQFVALADLIRIATFDVLLMFGVGFLSGSRTVRNLGAIAGGLFFVSKGLLVVMSAMAIGIFVMEIASMAATRLQQFGANAQTKARSEFGQDSPLTAFIIGLTLGLVWVPCAGPALGFAFALVREQPGGMAALALLSYALGTAVPLLAVGYGGQAAVHSVRSLAPYSGRVKQVAGVLLIATAVALQFRFFEDIQIWLLEHTSFGDLGTRIEQRIVGDTFDPQHSSSSSSVTMKAFNLPTISRAPEFTDLGPWHNGEPFTLASLKGKVVLIDFWTYSCINCIRTLPYIQGYWDAYKDTGKFVLLGVHTPEFIFEKDQNNVANAIKKHGLTYPTAQDNNFGTWSAFANRYWPAKYLIDANGYIRYTHFGEGAYEETSEAIASLLAEAGATVSASTVVSEDGSIGSGSISPETYLGSRSWPALSNAQGNPTSSVVQYEPPTSLGLHKYALVGSWQLRDDEAQVLRSETGEIRMRFQGGEVNLVLGLAGDAKPVLVTVMVDGRERNSFTVQEHDLYNLFSGEYGEHEVTLVFKGPGVEAFAFTFGR